MPGSISSLEIFGAGTHNASTGRITVTEADLDQIAQSFNELQGSNIVKPHLKLGHTDAQKWFGQKDGVPTLGWISKVWRQGTKLLADVVNVPDALISMLKQGRYHNVSAEVYYDAPIEHNGKKHTRVLSAVSLLGVEMPAVKDLAGLAGALFAEGVPSVEGATVVSITEEKSMPGDPALFNQEQLDALVTAAVTKAVGEAEKKFEGQITDLKAQVETLTKRAESAEGEVSKVKAAATVAEAENLVNTAIKDGKLLPKQKDFAMAFLSNPTMVKFGEGQKSTVEMFKEFLEHSGKVVNLSEKGAGGQAGTEYTSPAHEVDSKTREEMAKDSKLSYAEARNRILAADGDLKSRYALSA